MTLSTIKNVSIAVLSLLIIGLGIWIYREYHFNKDKSERLEENNRQIRLSDSIKYADVKLDKDQMNLYLKDNKNLLDIIEKNDIKFKQVTSVLNYLLKYKDTTIVKTDLSPILLAINKDPSSEDSFIQRFTDSTKCLVNKGFIKYTPNYSNDSTGSGNLSLVFTDREFLGETTVVGIWERRLWKLLWFKTRFLGKKEATVKIVDKCGESKILKVDLTKK